MFKKILLVAALTVTAFAQAGQDGNGGYGLECNGKLYVLDLYEAVNNHKLTVNLGTANLSVDEKVEIMLKRWEKLNKPLADEYRKKYYQMNQTSEILDDKVVMKDGDIIIGENISQVIDIGTTIIEKICKPVAMARNVDLGESVSTKIFFYRNYWNRLNNDGRAALKLHELIYYNVRMTEHNSQNVRRLIALLASDMVDTKPIQDSIRFAAYGQLFPISINGFLFKNIKPESIKMSSDSTFIRSFIAFPTPVSPHIIRFLNRDLEVQTITDNRSEYSEYATEEIEFATATLPMIFKVKSWGNKSSTDNIINIETPEGVLKIETQEDGSHISSWFLLNDGGSIQKIIFDRLQASFQFYDSNLIINKVFKTTIHDNGHLLSLTGASYTPLEIPSLLAIASTLEPRYDDQLQTVRYFINSINSEKDIKISNPYLKNAFLYSYNKASLLPSGKFSCVKIGNALSKWSVRIKNKTYRFPAGISKYVKFDENEQPLYFDCDPNTD